MRECSERRARLARLVDEVRAFAQREGIVLPDDGGRFTPSSGLPGARTVHVPNAPAGTRSLWQRMTS